MSKTLRILMACAALALVASCATSNMDGGIVGTGNRIDCEAKTQKDCANP